MKLRQAPSSRWVLEGIPTADALISGGRRARTKAVMRMLGALLVLLIGLVLGVAPALAAATSAEGLRATDNLPVVEQLRLEVPPEYRQIWLEAERSTWEPWLASQEGFLGRELLWDPLHGEATLLIRWASRQQWKAIPQAEIDAVQARFERQVNLRLGVQAPNPFPLLYEGELITP